MIGPKDYVNRAAQEILESENGAIHFNSTSQTFSGSYGAKFLKKDEFKLTEPLESKSDSVKTEGGPIKSDEQAKLEKKYTKAWINGTGAEGEIIDKQKFEELKKNRSDYNIFKWGISLTQVPTRYSVRDHGRLSSNGDRT